MSAARGRLHHLPGLPGGAVRRRLAALVLTVTALMTAALAGAADAPRRVVSINLCTDQLAMLVAGEGQLLSVSHLAYDRRSSAMADQAAQYVRNHGLAEEIYLMQPDLVLANRYTSPATTAMLERLGIDVVYFDITTSLEEVRDNLARMGEVLDRGARARQLIAAFDRDLARLRDEVAQRPRAALYYANGYTLGDRTLAGQILLAAGFRNVADETWIADSGIMPLEMLALAQPDAVISSRPYPGGSRAEEIMFHPVIDALREVRGGAAVSDRDWICGTPFVLRAIADMADLRRDIGARP